MMLSFSDLPPVGYILFQFLRSFKTANLRAAQKKADMPKANLL